MKIMKVDAINEIKNDRVHGASYLADKALETIKNALQTSPACDCAEFLQEMSNLAHRLTECRPTMASIGNCSSRFIFELQQYSANSPTLNSLREFSMTIVQNMQADFIWARSQTIEAGASLIENRNIIMTCSYSSTIVQIMAYAHNQGKSFQILMARSQEFPGDIAYGDRMASELAGYGIKCQVFSDDYVREKAKQADKIIVGADSINLDGSLVNGYPTAELALAAADANIPFYTVCESSKFLLRNITESIEKGFTLVPPLLITGIASEIGIITPNQVHQLSKPADAENPPK
jgi:translation initiation factor 2B subunit (eIF-2B alpha/beta/delta family)